ncbi:ovochymase-1 [Ahaetulla prasina]|uniref:ovochymase-1 n=1 Tax=Ahaetulla prasina TaxID=499056 RepID=UPI002648B7DB|nr:ovochymase-1 [Ahaetulla prasina]
MVPLSHCLSPSTWSEFIPVVLQLLYYNMFTIQYNLKWISFPSASKGRKCGFRFMDLEDDLQLGSFSRIIGGRMSVPGGQPWQVSIKRGRSHFCGGSLIGDDVVVTAAHCVVDFDLKVVKNLIVTVGEFDLGSGDEEEQSVPVSEIVVHPDFNKFGYMASDIALLYLKHQVQYGYEVQPICLPHKEDVFEAGTLCVVSGWGKTSEAGSLSNVLQEVELPIIDSITCSKLLNTLNLPPGQKSMLCAGFPDGRRDACKGDSGGPLACRKASGIWTLVGITSWGIGCGKGWVTDKTISGNRGSPGIFSKVNELLDFITQHLTTEAGPSFLLASSLEECNPHGTLVFGESGLVRYPRLAEDNYLDNSWCIWNLTVSEDKIILVEFIKLDVEDEIECDHDYVAFYSSEKELIGKICGDVLPSPLLIESDQATVIFVSDGSIGGRGFEFTFSAVHPASEAGSGCGSVAMLVEEGKIDTANYPGFYPSSTKCHWLIEAPVDRVIKLEFEDFAVEISQDCIYDAVVVYGDTEEEHQLALLCGFSIPSPVWSPGNIMLIHFESDEENNFKGFKAKFTFSSSATSKAEYEGLLSISAFEPKDIPLDICGFPPFGPQRLSIRIIGGEEACPHCWPWHVSLHFLGDYRCGGAIINSTWVLTAAHCVKITNNPSYWTVVAGNHDRILKEAAEQVRRVESITVHPAFDVASYDSDIALVQLQTPLIYSAAVRPVCLPSSMELLPSSGLCTVTGWASFQEVGGLATRLQQMHVPLVANDLCEQNYYFNHPGGITPQMLCAGFASLEGHDSCKGDSGLLVCQNENKPFILHGLASWGVGCAQPKRPGVYSRVSSFFDWIVSVMKEKGPAEMPISNIGLETLVRSLESPMNLLQAIDGQGSKIGSILKESNDLSQQLASCRDVILTAREGIIRTPGFPNGSSSATSCHWRIVAPLNAIIRLDFLDFVLENSLPKCHGGLILREGFGPTREMLGNFCNETPHYPVKSRTSMMMLNFTSGPDTNLKGFTLVYKIQETESSPVQDRDIRKGCPVLDLIPVGFAEIVSPNYPDPYPNLLNCTWIIYSASGSKLKTVIQDVVIEDAKDCIWDSLSFYDGPDQHSQLLGTLCGHKRNLQLFSSSSYLTVHFRTDGSVGAKGFKISFGETNQGSVPRSKNGIIELNSPWKCGIPAEDLFSIEAIPTNTSLEGQSKLELFSGNLASPASWPWLVSLQFENEHFCVGILIEKTWVLTAGHCNVSTQMDKAVVGITNLLPGTQISVKAVYFHANFSNLPPSNDISLLELEIPIQTGDTIGLICLPEQEEKIATDAKCLTAGWNITEGWFSRRLHQTQISLLAKEACTRYWGEAIKNTNICGSATGTTSCAQDLGEPLICKIDGRYKLVGLASWGSVHCEPESPTIYTQISLYKNWISAVINGKL